MTSGPEGLLEPTPRRDCGMTRHRPKSRSHSVEAGAGRKSTEVRGRKSEVRSLRTEAFGCGLRNLKWESVLMKINRGCTQTHADNFLSKILSGKMTEEDFDLLATTELILRGLAKAKFRNTSKIVVDGKTLYEHPEKKSDLRKTIDEIDEYSSDIKKGKQVVITAILADVEKCTATIKINKIHSIKEHSVDIQINGKIRKEIYHTFLNYLNEKIGLIENS